MPIPVQGQPDLVPTDRDRPPPAAGEQDLKWVVDGPQSQLDWGRKDRADTALALQHLVRAAGVVAAVYLVSFTVALPPEIMLLGAVLGGGYLLFVFVFGFGGTGDQTASNTGTPPAATGTAPRPAPTPSENTGAAPRNVTPPSPAPAKPAQ